MPHPSAKEQVRHSADLLQKSLHADDPARALAAAERFRHLHQFQSLSAPEILARRDIIRDHHARRVVALELGFQNVGELDRAKASAVEPFLEDAHGRRFLLSPRERDVLESAVARGGRIVVAGGTGAGKTSLLQLLIDLRSRVRADERIGVYEPGTDEISLPINGIRAQSLVEAMAENQPLRPHWLAVNEIRSENDALILALAWERGGPGGAVVVHGDGAERALSLIQGLADTADHPGWVPTINPDVVVTVARRAGETSRRLTVTDTSALPPRVARAGETLERWIFSGCISQQHADLVRQTLDDGRGVLIAGPSRSGKTALLHAVLQYIEDALGEPIALVEDDESGFKPRPPADKLPSVVLRTTPNVGIERLLTSALRKGYRRMAVDEIRDPETAAWIADYWVTGLGGVATITAPSATEAAERFTSLADAQDAGHGGMGGVGVILVLGKQHRVVEAGGTIAAGRARRK